MTIVPDGQVEVGPMLIGFNAQSSGTVNLNGAGATLIVNGRLTVGGGGDATINISGGLLSTQALSTIAGPHGLVKIINGGIWYAGQPSNRQDIDIQGANGHLQLDNGTVYGNVIDVRAGGLLSGNGTIDGELQETGGTIRPGVDGGLKTIGTLTVNGSFDATGGGKYIAEIAGPGDNDLLSISDTASLGGSMIVPAIGSPDFVAGQSYTVLTAANVVGQFTNLPAALDQPSGVYVGDFRNDPDLPALPSSLAWEIQYAKTAVILSIVPTVSLQSNGDIYETDTSPGSFTVTRSGPTTNSLTVSYTTSGTAISGTDYAGLSGSVTIPAGSRTANIYVTPEDDSDTDDNQASETLDVALQRQVGGYALGTPQSAEMTIREEPLPTVTIAATAPNAVEAGADGQFTVSRTGPLDDQLYVTLASSGTAVAGTNYQALPAGVLIWPGARSAVVTVHALDDGPPGTGDPETVTETVQPGSGYFAYYVGTPSSANVSIQEEGYTTVTIAATTPSTYEGASLPGEFTVTRQAPYDQPLVVNYSLSGTAVSGADYQPLSGTVTIPAGSPTAPIDVTPLDDGDGDDTGAGESVIATLGPSSNYQVGQPSSDTVTIGEEPPVVSIAVSQPDTSEQDPQGAVFTVTRTGATTSAATVGFALTGTAQKGVDFVDPASTVTIPVGQSSASFSIVPIDDGDNDDSQTSE